MEGKSLVILAIVVKCFGCKEKVAAHIATGSKTFACPNCNSGQKFRHLTETELKEYE